ncbi:MAG: PKD domain-containing protein [bacterium]|nr:PKD domain-containing protein [bacterium]
MVRMLTLALVVLLLLSGCSGVSPSATSDDTTLTAALAELDALAAPDGMSPQQFGALKQSLRSALLSSGKSKFVAAAPAAAAGAVTDLALTVQGGGTVNLDWTYRNKGDYDQNRQVTISDLSALGANLGKTSVSPDWLSKAIAADGDSNGEVNISDITPIGANFIATVSGYKVQSTTTPANTSSWSEVADVAFDTSSIPGGSALRVFSHTLTATPQTWYRVVAYDGTDLGSGSNEVQYALSAPDVTAVSPLSGEAGTAVSFIATNTGGTPTTWVWDFGGGAVPDTASVPFPDVTLGAAGSYSASVTVNNAAGNDTFNFTLDVTSPAPPVIDDVLPQSGSEGAQLSFSATLSGGPVATYAWDFGGGATPDTDSSISPFVTLGTAGIYPASLTVTNAGGTDIFNFNLNVNNPPTASFTATPQNGNPGDPVVLDASASSDPGGSIVKYEWDLDGDGTFEVDGGATPTQATTLPNPAGSVDVSVRVTDDGNATDTATLTLSSGILGWPTLTPDSAEVVGRYSSLEVVNGFPAISYYDSSNGALKFVRASDADGSAWGAPVVPDSVGVGTQTSLAVVNGNPAISYFDNINDDLKYVRASDADGSAWGAPLTVDSSGYLGSFSVTSLTVVNGNPAVSYTSNTASDDLTCAPATRTAASGARLRHSTARGTWVTPPRLRW